jgi:hypothetical protein
MEIKGIGNQSMISEGNKSFVTDRAAGQEKPKPAEHSKSSFSYIQSRTCKA